MAQPKPLRVRVETKSVVSVVLWGLSWELTGTLLAIRWLFRPGWLSLHQEWVALAVSISLSVYHAAWGRASARRYLQVKQTGREALTWRQAFIIVALVVIAGTFFTWLFLP
jgi:hypothetical protein